MVIKVKKPQLLENKFNLENEEKPIVEPLTMTSEDVHGGDEITQSVDDQRFAQQEPSKEQEESEQEEQEQTGEQNEEEKEKQEGENEETEREQTGEQETEQEREEKETEKSEQEEENKEEQEQTEEQEQEQESEEENEEKEKNSEQAFKLKKEALRLHLELYRLIEYLSNEEKALTPEPSQTQALNIKKLIFRQFERKPLSSYYEYRERSEIILVLDTSGSMTWIKEALNTFFSVALKRKDIQVFIAPNGIIETTYDPKTKKFQEIEHENAMRTIIQSRLPVLYIGDFDGANTPVELSWHNKVFWVCTETRYKYFSEHDWVDYNEEQFKGFFGRAWNEKEIVLVLKEFAKHIMEPRFWLDLHKDEDFEEDEE